MEWQADGAPLQRAAAGHTDTTFIFPDNANHVLKHEVRPRSELAPAEVATGYNAADARLDPETLATMLEWLAAQS